MTDTIIKITVLLAIVTVAAHLLRRHSAALRHLLWTFSIVAIVAIPLLTEALPFKLEIVPTDLAILRAQTDSRAARDFVASSTPIQSRAGSSAPPTAPAPEAGAASGDDLAIDAAGRPLSLGRLLLIAWIVGALGLIGRYTIGLIRVQRIARRSMTVTDESWLQLADRAARSLDVREPVDIRRSEEVAMPFAYGLLDPVIVLPAVADEWSTERRAAVLMHEFAHISRGDLAMNTVSHFARALYWFHPLAWLAAYRLRVEGERACDDAVLRAGALPSDYAEHLLSIVRSVGATVPNVALAMARRSDFEGRLLAILEPGVPRAKLTRVRAAGLAALFLAAVMPLAAMAPASPASNVETPARETALQNPPPPAARAPSPSTSSSATPTPSTAREQEKPSSSALAATIDALAETLNDANYEVRLAAVNSLGQLQDPRAIAALSKVLKEDSDPRVREAAAHALDEIDDTRAVPALLEALRTEKAANVREKIVHALGEIDDPAALQGIAGVVRDPSVKVRRAAVWALGELDDPAALPALLSMTRDEDVEVRKHVAEALGNLEGPSTIEALSALAKDVHPDVRTHAIEALGDLQDMRTLSTLIAALKDEHHDVMQSRRGRNPQHRGHSDATQPLVRALRDESASVRRSAAWALGSLEAKSAQDALITVLERDTDARVRQAAAWAIGQLH